MNGELDGLTGVPALKVAEAVAGGLSPLCATCEHYWEGRDRNPDLPLCKMAGLDSNPGGKPLCGGPLKGMSFPRYKGPMGEEMIQSVCFMTGDQAAYGVRLGSSAGARLLGISAGRLPAFADQVMRSGSERLKGRVQIIDRNGEARLAIEFAPAPAGVNTLGALLGRIASGHQSHQGES